MTKKISVKVIIAEVSCAMSELLKPQHTLGHSFPDHQTITNHKKDGEKDVEVFCAM